MSTHSVIEHRANYHFLKVEEDYVAICSKGEQSAYCKALILAVLEHWTNDKCDKGQDEFIYMTYPQWIESIYGLFQRNVIIKCLAELVQQHLILRKPHKMYGKETFAYKLNVPLLQERLKSLPDAVEKSTRPKINACRNQRVPKSTRVEKDGKEESAVDKRTADALILGRNIDTNIDTNIDSVVGKNDEDPSETAGASAPTQPHLPVKKPEAKPPSSSQGELLPRVTPKQALERKVATCFQVLEAVKKEATKDPGACYATTKADAQRLAELLRDWHGKPNEVTRDSLKAAWLELYNRPDHWWLTSGRLTVKAFCANYGAAMDAVRLAERSKPRADSDQPRELTAIEKLKLEQARYVAALPVPEREKVAL
jgi:hypothetical protein